MAEHTDLSEVALIELIRTRRPDCMLFDVELRVDVLTQWTRLLKEGLAADCRVVGRFYGFPKWKETTLAINLLLGPPERVCADGSWSVALSAEEFRQPRLRRVLPRLQSGERREAIVWLMVRDEEDMECLTRWLFGPLAGWQGRIGIIDAAHSPSLQIMRELCDLRVIASFPEEPGTTWEPLTAHALAIIEREPAGNVIALDLKTASLEDFARGVSWNGDSVLMSVASTWGRETAKARRDFAGEVERIIERPPDRQELAGLPADWRMFACTEGSRELREWRRLAAWASEARLRHPAGAALAAAVLKQPEGWTLREAAQEEPPGWDLPPEQLRRIGGLLSPPVRPPAGALLLVAVPEAEAELFLSCLSAWRFSGKVDLMAVSSPAVAAGLAPLLPEVAWEAAGEEAELRSGEKGSRGREREREALERWALRKLAQGNGGWKRLLVLNARSHPVPGAVLFGDTSPEKPTWNAKSKRPRSRAGEENRAGPSVAPKPAPCWFPVRCWKISCDHNNPLPASGDGGGSFLHLPVPEAIR